MKAEKEREEKRINKQIYLCSQCGAVYLELIKTTQSFEKLKNFLRLPRVKCGRIAVKVLKFVLLSWIVHTVEKW